MFSQADKLRTVSGGATVPGVKKQKKRNSNLIECQPTKRMEFSGPALEYTAHFLTAVDFKWHLKNFKWAIPLKF